ncbi:MAG: hypothetical protein HKN45_03845 [Flavobacteriales bacterium]|nr:hypothetical protein [Flavobacteriales bacterium]
MSTKSKERKHIDDLHFEHNVWKNQLNFCKDELEFFKRRLEEISQRYTDEDILKRLEHFQNQFIIQRDEIDRFLHDINVHEDHLAKEAMENPVATDHLLMHDHPAERERFDTFNDLYSELKKEYMTYLRRWM